MFDTLVESSKHGQENTKTGIYMLVTGSIYAVGLLVIGVATIIYMNPGLADAFDVAAMIAPPPPPAAPPPPAPTVAIKNIPVTPTFVPPTKPPEKIPDPATVQPKQVVAVSHGVPGGVSGGVLQGKAINKIQPPYPPIAKAARASGAVQVQVTISEDGRVIEAAVMNGHPLLRDAALQAARRWKCQPTELSGVHVKVQGILTFNFTLQ